MVRAFEADADPPTPRSKGYPFKLTAVMKTGPFFAVVVGASFGEETRLLYA
jgi:hypothetical protein